jgi:hypothetical protein
MLILLLDEWLPTGASLNIAGNQIDLEEDLRFIFNGFRSLAARAAF